MGISDSATMHEEMLRDIAQQQRKPDGPSATGACLWCEAQVPHGRRWCDAECRDDWEASRR